MLVASRSEAPGPARSAAQIVHALYELDQYGVAQLGGAHLDEALVTLADMIAGRVGVVEQSRYVPPVRGVDYSDVV